MHTDESLLHVPCSFEAEVAMEKLRMNE